MPSFRVRDFIVIGLGAVAGALAYSRLPAHLLVPGLRAASVGSWLGRPMAAFLLPIAAGVISVVIRQLSRCDSPGDDSRRADVRDAILFRWVLFITALHVTILGAMLGMLSGRAWAERAVPMLFGVALMSVGNLLPRLRPNAILGIRTARTLADRAFWIQMHRLAGYLVVGIGGTMTVSALLLPPGTWVRGVVSVATGIAALVFTARFRSYSRA